MSSTTPRKRKAEEKDDDSGNDDDDDDSDYDYTTTTLLDKYPDHFELSCVIPMGNDCNILQAPSVAYLHDLKVKELDNEEEQEGNDEADADETNNNDNSRNETVARMVEERVQEQMAEIEGILTTQSDEFKGYKLVGFVVSTALNKGTKEERKAFRKRLDEYYKEKGHYSYIDWKYNEDPCFETFIVKRLAQARNGGHPVEYCCFYNNEKHHQLFFMKSGHLDFCLLNGKVYSCMLCRRIYYTRYMDGEAQCVRCSSKEHQQAISDYGFVG